MRRLPGRGPAHRAPHPDRRHPGRGRRRVDPAAGRSRPGRLPGRAQRRPLRPPGGRGPTTCSSGRASTCTPPSTCRWPWPPWAAASPSTPSTTPRDLPIAGGHPERHGPHPEGPRRARSCGAGAGATSTCTSRWTRPPTSTTTSGSCSPAGRAPVGGAGRGTPRRGPLLQAALGAELTVGPGRGDDPGLGRPAGDRRPRPACLVGCGRHGLRGRPGGPRGRRRRRRATSSTCCASGPGEPVVAADGAGRWVPCRVAPTAPAGGPRGADPARPAGARRPGRDRAPAGPEVTVAFAPTKGDRPEWVVQKLTELGVDRIVPLRTARSVVRWEGDRAARRSSACGGWRARRRPSAAGPGCPR